MVGKNHDTFVRMPLGYGITPGPRQSTPKGVSYQGWDVVRTTTVTITFRSSKDLLSSFLPHDCFSILTTEDKSNTSNASFIFTKLENLPWLAGRGYDMCGFFIHNVACRGRDEVVQGNYLSVLFENLADPITSGREELGFAKVYTSLQANQDADKYEVEIGWEGTVFGRMSLKRLQLQDHDTANSQSSKSSEGTLHFKYVPKTGTKGMHDAMYPTYSPPPPHDMARVLRRWMTTDAQVSFKDLGFDDLPTLHHIASRLAELKFEVLEASIVESVGFTDLGDQRAITL